MKKKIYAIVAVSALFLTVAVIATGVEEINKNNASRNENGPSPRRDRSPKDNITGILKQNNDSFYIKDIELFFGPKELISKQASQFDYDSDEIIETIQAELKGLTGTSITINGELQSNKIIKVCEINGMPLDKLPRPPKNDIGGNIDSNIESK